MPRPYHSRYTPQVLRARLNLEQSQAKLTSSEIKILQKVLYRCPFSNSFYSLSDPSGKNTSKTIEPGLSLDLNSVKLVQDSETSLTGISFTSSSITDFEVSVFYFGKEVIDTAKKAQYLSLDKLRSPKPFTLKLPAGESQGILISPQLDLSKFTQSELNFEDSQTFPLIIFLKSEKEMRLYYFKICEEGIVKVRESYTVSEKTFEVLEVYETENEECVICVQEVKKCMIFPCRHVSVCENCLQNLNKLKRSCPICRGPVKAIYKLPG